MALTIPQSVYASFRHTNPHQRWGQAFHGHLELHKCHRDREWARRLFNERDDARAKAMVQARLDPIN